MNVSDNGELYSLKFEHDTEAFKDCLSALIDVYFEKTCLSYRDIFNILFEVSCDLQMYDDVSLFLDETLEREDLQ